MVLNFLAKMKYLLKYSNFVPYIIAPSVGFVKKICDNFDEKKMKENKRMAFLSQFGDSKYNMKKRIEFFD